MASATDQAPGLLKRFAAAVEAGSVGEDEEDLLVELKVERERTQSTLRTPTPPNTLCLWYCCGVGLPQLALTQYQSLPPIARETANAAAERIVARTSRQSRPLLTKAVLLTLRAVASAKPQQERRTSMQHCSVYCKAMGGRLIATML